MPARRRPRSSLRGHGPPPAGNFQLHFAPCIAVVCVRIAVLRSDFRRAGRGISRPAVPERNSAPASIAARTSAASSDCARRRFRQPPESSAPCHGSENILLSGTPGNPLIATPRPTDRSASRARSLMTPADLVAGKHLSVEQQHPKSAAGQTLGRQRASRSRAQDHDLPGHVGRTVDGGVSDPASWPLSLQQESLRPVMRQPGDRPAGLGRQIHDFRIGKRAGNRPRSPSTRTTNDRVSNRQPNQASQTQPGAS